jgi:hypothetical protein
MARAVGVDFVCGIAAVGVALFVVPAIAEAHRGDGVFSVAISDGDEFSSDVAMLSDGSIVGSGGWRITPDGRRSVIPDFHGTGVAATADGGVLGIQGGAFDHRVVRWVPGVGGVSVVAGTGRYGFGGDGGAATEALLALAAPGPFDPSGIVAFPDGGFVFVDTGNDRIRAVDAAGVIRTVAGGPAGKIRDPVGLARTPDGGYLVSEDSGRVLRVGPDGATERVADGAGNDLVVFADGAAVTNDPWTAELSLLEPRSRTFRPYLRPAQPTGPFDFAARAVSGDGIALDPHGGLLAGGRLVPWWRGSVLTYMPNGPTPWTLVALRDTRTSRGAVTAVIEATQPGIATFEIARGERTIAHVSQPVAAGHSTLRAVGSIRARWYDARIRLENANGATASDQIPIHGARTLSVRLARRLLKHDAGIGEPPVELGRDCRAFGKRRVDCLIVRKSATDCDRYSADESGGVASVTLERSGVVLRRDYPCGRHRRIRPRPRYLAAHGVQRLSSGWSGTWYPLTG